MLRINALGIVSRMAAVDAMCEWMDASGVARDAWSIVGPCAGREFRIQMAGTSGLAARRVSKCIKQLRDDAAAGGWRKFFAASPSGARMELFIGSDKSPMHIAVEKGIKALCRHLSSAHPEVDIFGHRRNGLIWSHRTPLVRLTAPTKEAFIVEWNSELADTIGVDRARAKAALEASARAASATPIPWSV